MTAFLEETQEFERLVEAAQGDAVSVPYEVARAVCTAIELSRHSRYWVNPRAAAVEPINLPLPLARFVLERAKTNIANRVARSLSL